MRRQTGSAGSEQTAAAGNAAGSEQTAAAGNAAGSEQTAAAGNAAGSEQTAAPETDDDARYSFSVMQWNTLADSLCTPAQFPSADPCVLGWERRGPQIVRHILDLDADLVALQEVEPSSYRATLQPALTAAGYDGTYHPKTDSSHGSALFFRSAKFKMMAYARDAYLGSGCGSGDDGDCAVDDDDDDDDDVESAAQNQGYLFAYLAFVDDHQTQPPTQAAAAAAARP
jgi:mRNA deadenylase 3'-5' endonuclease subunit Ccr4